MGTTVKPSDVVTALIGGGAIVMCALFVATVVIPDILEVL